MLVSYIDTLLLSRAPKQLTQYTVDPTGQATL